MQSVYILDRFALRTPNPALLKKASDFLEGAKQPDEDRQDRGRSPHARGERSPAEELVGDGPDRGGPRREVARRFPLAAAALDLVEDLEGHALQGLAFALSLRHERG